MSGSQIFTLNKKKDKHEFIRKNQTMDCQDWNGNLHHRPWGKYSTTYSLPHISRPI